MRTELRYATENNFTGQIIYSFDEAWLRYGTVQKLAKAQECLADRDYSDVPEEATQNAILLETVMTDCGFKPYSGEWWHFSDTDAYPVEESFVPD